MFGVSFSLSKFLSFPKSCFSRFPRALVLYLKLDRRLTDTEGLVFDILVLGSHGNKPINHA